MDRERDIYRENKETVLLLIIPIAVLAKLIEHLILPDKYFYDSSRMLNTMLNSDYEGAWGGNYQVTVDFFNKLNVFKFTTLLQWSLLIGIIFTLIFFVVIGRLPELDFVQSIFLLMCIGLCNIYVFNLGKDIIQMGFFMMCFIIISIKTIPNWGKVIGCATVFFWESTFFRNYYIIMAVFTVGVYFIISIIRNKNIKLSTRKLLLILFLLYFIMYMFLYLAKIYMPEDYEEIMICKAGTEYMSASTMIYDYVDFGRDVNLYMLNYIINSIRMLFPLELLTGGVFYLPFLAFQILLLYSMYKSIRNIHIITEKNVIALCVFIAFFMGSVLFEPDFGSFARHEAAAFPIIILFSIHSKDKTKIKDDDDKRIVIYE